MTASWCSAAATGSSSSASAPCSSSNLRRAPGPARRRRATRPSVATRGLASCARRVVSSALRGRRRVVVFGGSNNRVAFNGVWILDAAAMEWHVPVVHGRRARAAHGPHGLVQERARQSEMVLFGRYDSARQRCLNVRTCTSSPRRPRVGTAARAGRRCPRRRRADGEGPDGDVGPKTASGRRGSGLEPPPAAKIGPPPSLVSDPPPSGAVDDALRRGRGRRAAARALGGAKPPAWTPRAARARRLWRRRTDIKFNDVTCLDLSDVAAPRWLRDVVCGGRLP